ncbi:MAG: hypothetical protein KGL35_32685 [Bradyrhizobium sp.]|nr:hypothetical protein [Bradyrhizobium sp.]
MTLVLPLPLVGKPKIYVLIAAKELGHSAAAAHVSLSMNLPQLQLSKQTYTSRMYVDVSGLFFDEPESEIVAKTFSPVTCGS